VTFSTIGRSQRPDPRVEAREQERLERLRVSRTAARKAKELLDASAKKFPDHKPLGKALRAIEKAVALEKRCEADRRRRREEVAAYDAKILDAKTDPDGSRDLSRIASLQRRAARLRADLADDERLTPVAARKVAEATRQALLVAAPLWRVAINEAAARAEAARATAKEAEQVIAREREKHTLLQREIPILAGQFTECEALAREIGAKER